MPLPTGAESRHWFMKLPPRDRAAAGPARAVRGASWLPVLLLLALSARAEDAFRIFEISTDARVVQADRFCSLASVGWALAAGVVCLAKPGDEVTAGEPLLELHTSDPTTVERFPVPQN